MRRWLTVIVAVVALAAGGFAGWVYFASEASLHHRYALPAQAALPAPTAGAAVRGAKLAFILGCTHCHGDDLRGEPFPEPEPFDAVTSANLTQRAHAWSDADFARLLRAGLTPKGESTQMMPSESFVRLTDQEVVDLVAYLRSLPRGGPNPPIRQVGWRARWVLTSGGFPPGVDFVRKARAKPSLDLGPQYAAARHLVDIACTECHGSDLTGDKSGKPPNLTVAGAYDPADFHRLLKTGLAAGGREVGLMSRAARTRFSHFTDDEVEAIRLYLVARANAPA